MMFNSESVGKENLLCIQFNFLRASRVPRTYLVTNILISSYTTKMAIELQTMRFCEVTITRTL